MSKEGETWVGADSATVCPGRGPGGGDAWPPGGVAEGHVRFRECRGPASRPGDVAVRWSKEIVLWAEVPKAVHSRLGPGEALADAARGSLGRLGREGGIQRAGLLCFRCVRRPRIDRTGKSPQAGAGCMSSTGEAGTPDVLRRVVSEAMLGVPAMVAAQ